MTLAVATVITAAPTCLYMLGAQLLPPSLVGWVFTSYIKTLVLKEVQKEKTCPKPWSQGAWERRCEPLAFFPSHPPASLIE